MAFLKLCRFDNNGTLSLSDCDITTTKFIAISHIWGDVSWRAVSGIPFEILVSSRKAKFISETLPSLIPSGQFFWMDVLCVDQSSKEARIGVVQHIRDIYRRANKTIIVREAGGFGPCCADNLHQFRKAKEDGSYYLQSVEDTFGPIRNHLGMSHSTGIQEKWLARVWPLQELLLSDAIQFTVCEANDGLAGGSSQGEFDATNSTIDQLLQLADLWARRGQWTWNVTAEQQSQLQAEQSRRGRISKEFMDTVLRTDEVLSRRREAITQFINALLGSGIAVRGEVVTGPPGYSATPFDQLRRSQESKRETSKPRDFILAVMPQFEWYLVPSNAVSANFGMFYADCAQQIKSRYNRVPSRTTSLRFSEETQLPQDIKPKIPRGLVEGSHVSAHDSFEPSSNVPIPKTLGEFCRMLWYSRYDDPQWVELQRRFPPGAYWELQSISTIESTDSTLESVARTLWFANFKNQSIFAQQWECWQRLQSELEEAIEKLRSQNPISEENQQVQIRMEANLRDIREEMGTLGPPGVGSLVYKICEYQSRVRELPLSTYKDEIRLRSEMLPGMMIRWSDHESWAQVVKWFTEHDNRAFREATLQLATTIACGLGMSALPWIRQHLRPNLLVLHDAQRVERRPLEQVLCFASTNFEIDQDAEISCYNRAEAPYILMKSKNDNGARVVGIYPEPDYWVRDERFSMQFEDQGMLSLVEQLPIDFVETILGENRQL